MNERARGSLEQQMNLLHQRSREAERNADVVEMSEAMIKIATLLQDDLDTSISYDLGMMAVKLYGLHPEWLEEVKEMVDAEMQRAALREQTSKGGCSDEKP